MLGIFIFVSMKKEAVISRTDVVWIISIILSNWYWFIMLPSVFWASAYLYAYKQQEVYAASCQIMLKDESSFQSQFQEQFKKVSPTFSYEYTAGQMRVIKSSDLVEKVLDELHLEVRYFIVGRLKVSELYHHVPFTVNFDQRATAVFGTLFNIKVQSKESFLLSYTNEAGSYERKYQFGELITDNGLYLKIDLHEGKFYQALTELDYQFQVNPKNFMINKYKNAITVENLDYTSIIEIELTDEIPARAVDFLKVLSKEYLQTTIQNQITINENTQQYIDDLLGEISGVVQGIESELDSFKVDKNIINLGREESVLFGRLLALETQKREIELELDALDDLAEYVLSTESLKMMMPPSVFLRGADDQIMTQLNELFEHKKRYQESLEASNPANPRMEKYLVEMEQFRKDILSYKANQESAQRENLKRIVQESNAIESKIKFLPIKERELLNIEKKIKVNEGLYDYLLSRRAEVLIARAALVPQTQVIEVPRSKGVIYPDKEGFALNALLLGFGLAIAIILIREFFFRKIRTRMELENITELSIIGSVPEEKKMELNFLIKSGKERGQVIQAFRAIRASLQYIPKKKQCHKILITSLMPGEGKTFVSANLANVLALADKKVLVVDFDMHKPRLHNVFGVSRDFGLSNFLAGKSELKAVIKNSELTTCDVISAGPIPPNASELVLQSGLEELLQYADENYDYLVLDTPPSAIISDSLVIMPKVDTNIFVCSSFTTTRTSLDHIQKIVSENNIHGVALLFNKERRTRLDAYYAKYGYGGYGYGYGYQYKYDDQ
jgi:tyrosine-protein kinase Etk/Wzc